MSISVFAIDLKLYPFLEPRMQAKVERMREKLIFVLIQDVVSLKSNECFSVIHIDSLVYNNAHSRAIPPVDENTRGVNEPCSISIILLL